MSETPQGMTSNISLRERLGGRWAISLSPYLWTTPIVVGVIPFSSQSPGSDFSDLMLVTAFSTLSWIAFGFVLFIGHLTYFRNRAIMPVHPLATITLGAIAGLVRSLVSGDWFAVFGQFGLHSINLVVNAVLTGILWIALTSGFMHSKHSFMEVRAKLIADQSALLQSGEQWLLDVRNRRFELAESVREQLRADWQRTRVNILEKLNDDNNHWESVIDDLALASIETVSSLSASMRHDAPKSSGVLDGFRIIARTPLYPMRGTGIVISLLGLLPTTRLVGLLNGILLITAINVVLLCFVQLSRIAVQKMPERSITIYWLLCLGIGAAPMPMAPILSHLGLSKEVSIAFVIIGGMILVSTFIAFSFIALNQLIRTRQIASLQKQNLLLDVFDNIHQRQTFEARIDLASYLTTTINSSIKSARETIELGIANHDIDSVNSGLAVIDAVYSNVLARYTSEEAIDFRHELNEITEPWSNIAIITWHLDIVGLEREISRRLLLVIAQCISHLMTQDLAQRVHVEVSGSFSKAKLSLECNANVSWLEANQLTQDVLDATAGTDWSISGTSNSSTLVVAIQHAH